MSGNIPCTCTGSRNERIKFWYVPEGQRNKNYSYFQKPKGKAHYSDYSTVYCSRCSMSLRSKGLFVRHLPNGYIKQTERR